MPQMSPMDWFYLNIYFLFIYYMVILLVYFLNLNNLSLINLDKNIKLNNFEIKWY